MKKKKGGEGKKKRERARRRAIVPDGARSPAKTSSGRRKGKKNLVKAVREADKRKYSGSHEKKKTTWTRTRENKSCVFMCESGI